jgi:hypothetical protein
MVSFAAITLRVVSQLVFIVVYFIIDSVRKLLDTPSYYSKGIWKPVALKCTHNGRVCVLFVRIACNEHSLGICVASGSSELIVSNLLLAIFKSRVRYTGHVARMGHEKWIKYFWLENMKG